LLHPNRPQPQPKTQKHLSCTQGSHSVAASSNIQGHTSPSWAPALPSWKQVLRWVPVAEGEASLQLCSEAWGTVSTYMVYTHRDTQIHLLLEVHKHACEHTDRHIYAHREAHTEACVHTDTCTHTWSHTHVYSETHMHTNTCAVTHSVCLAVVLRGLPSCGRLSAQLSRQKEIRVGEGCCPKPNLSLKSMRVCASGAAEYWVLSLKWASEGIRVQPLRPWLDFSNQRPRAETLQVRAPPSSAQSAHRGFEQSKPGSRSLWLPSCTLRWDVFAANSVSVLFLLRVCLLCWQEWKGWSRRPVHSHALDTRRVEWAGGGHSIIVASFQTVSRNPMVTH
jgi:hypothetical protein